MSKVKVENLTAMKHTRYVWTTLKNLLHPSNLQEDEQGVTDNRYKAFPNVRSLPVMLHKWMSYKGCH